MKKLIPDEKNWKNKLARFFNNKGFYIVLAVCILIVAATAIYVSTQNMNSPDAGVNSKLIPGDANAANGQVDDAKAVSGNVGKADTTKKTTAANTPAKAAASKAKTAAVIKFDRPVDGPIMKDFTRDATTFSESKTLGDIRAHTGIDFKVDKLTKVRAVADGTVFSVENNENGITVVISHETSGLKTKYAGLSAQGLEDISCGMKVKANEIIGHVGDPIQNECEDGAHLHFEVLKNGKSVDPLQYLKSTSSSEKQSK
jgi:murein DD-endopeptidase MepM/ murein hydrolase activator NlpD